tara:strand:+ start:99 stop:887 length:789 start_codon:yes stop_codon:yes gene_type:complete
MSYFKKSSQEVNTVYKTNDLSMFSEVEGNRPPNPQHIRRLSDSIKTNGLLCNPILVNEKMQIIDGQHRLLAAKDSNSDIYYIILKGYSLKEVHALNLNQKNWGKKDFMNGYADMGVESYIKLRGFTRNHKGFNFGSAVSMCSNRAGNGCSSLNDKYRGKGAPGNLKEVFEEGTWKGRDFNLADENANKLEMIKQYYDGYNRTTFVSVMLGLFTNDEFNFVDFLSKLKIQPQKMQHCANTTQYRLLIEDIYNYRRREKVNLRY